MHEVHPPVRDPERQDNPDWPWDQPPQVGAITCRSVLEGAPVLHVTHDADDHGWQFLDGNDADIGEGRIVAMRHVLEIDPRLREIADLPPGWLAWRESAAHPWRREPHA